MRLAIAMLSILAAAGCTHRFAVAHVWGGARGSIADRWYIEDPASAQLAPDGRFAVLVSESGHAVLVAAPSGARVTEITAHASPRSRSPTMARASPSRIAEDGRSRSTTARRRRD